MCGPLLNIFMTTTSFGRPKATWQCVLGLSVVLNLSSLIRPLEDLKPCLGINEISSSFFSLLLEILLLEGQASLPMVRVLGKSGVQQSFRL